MAATKRELDLKDFPPGTITEYTTLVCLACIFDIFTKQLGLAPRTAFSEVKRHTPTIEELTSRTATRPYFDSEEKSPHCPFCGSSKRWLARFDTFCIEGGKTPGKDARSSKATYPGFYGIEATRAQLEIVHRAACNALERIDTPTELLRSIADLIRERQA